MKLKPQERVQFARASLEQLRGHLSEMTYPVPHERKPRNMADHILMFHLDAIENGIASWEAWQKQAGEPAVAAQEPRKRPERGSGR